MEGVLRFHLDPAMVQSPTASHDQLGHRVGEIAAAPADIDLLHHGSRTVSHDDERARIGHRAIDTGGREHYLDGTIPFDTGTDSDQRPVADEGSTERGKC